MEESPENALPQNQNLVEEAKKGMEEPPTPPEAETEIDENEKMPAENEEAKVFNPVSVVSIGVVILIFIFAVIQIGSMFKKKEVTSNMLDKAGRKTVVDFKDRTEKNSEDFAPIAETFSSDTEKFPVSKSDKREKENPAEVPEDDLSDFEKKYPLPQGKAPVAPTGSGNSYKSDRPDTRNSKSPRKIAGINGKEISSDEINQNVVNAVMNGSSRQRLTKEEYIAQQMSQTQKLQETLYGSNGGSSGLSASQINRKNFYNENQNDSGVGSGNYLSYNSLWDGTIISGALITAINTDNPGVVIARVTQNVYSSYDHSFLLIPEGSLLYATYNSSVSYGQNKIQVAWNLLIRPDGYRIVLGNMNGVNALGESGYRGKVSNHPWETLKALGMIAVYSMIETEVTADINSQDNEFLQNAMTDVWTEASKMGNKILDRALDIQPTIKIKSGTEIKIITNTSLELPPCKVDQATKKYVRTK
jgi:type IV secretion system protein VirB10